MTDLQRIRKALNWLIFSEYAKNDNDLAVKLGYSKSSFSQIINGKVPLSDKFIDKVCSIDENINKVWIRTGNGSVLIRDNFIRPPTLEKCSNCEIMEAKLEGKNLLIEQLESRIKNNEAVIEQLLKAKASIQDNKIVKRKAS